MYERTSTEKNYFVRAFEVFEYNTQKLIKNYYRTPFS